MKGNFAWACLLLCWLPPGAAGQVMINGQIMNFNGNVQFRGGNSTAKPVVMPEARTDVLEFVDGSALHGQLSRMDLDHGLAWVTPEAKNAISFRPDHVNFIRFARPQDVRAASSCHLRFGNGDDLYGSISTLDNQRLGFKTWFGGEMSIPRPALRSITFLSSNYAVAYDGPYDEGGWTILSVSPDSWTFHDGAFVGAGTGGLGRDLGLTNSVTVEFDLAWTGAFSLMVCVYSDAQERMDAANGCAVDFTPRQVSLRQARNTGGVFNLNGVPLALEAGKSRMHAAIQCDKSEGTVSVFVNNQLLKIWKDCDFSNAGTGVSFLKNYGYFNYQNSFVTGGTVQLSRLRISQWQGRCEPETLAPATNADGIRFVNHDRAAGKIQAIQDGRIKLVLAGTDLEIPLERVAEIDFAETNATAEPTGPWAARAHFPGGGSLSFQLEKWDDRTISGRSAIFGPLALQSAAVREIEFNLDRPKGNGVTAAVREFEELDE